MEAESRAGFLRGAADALQRYSNDRLGSRHDEVFASRGAGPRLPTAVIENNVLRASWGLVAMWLVARLRDAVDHSASLHEAEEWFLGRCELTRHIRREGIEAASEQLKKLTVDGDLDELLPYVLDPVGLGTRRAVIRDEGQTTARNKRKSGGVYYTPGDVANFMLGAIGALDSDVGRLLDPACGTGVFLRSAVRRGASSGRARSTVAQRLFGVDLSLWAVEHCAFVLTAEVLKDATGLHSPYETWLGIRSRLVAADALLLLSSRGPDEGHVLQSLLGETNEGFEYIVANPPYSPLGKHSRREDLASRFESLQGGWTASTNSYVPFVELMWRMSSEDGETAMVVPLSIAYSSASQIRHLRTAMEASGGEWRFAFFDRTPDALFGDDVKQRSAILIRSGGSTFSASTGPLQRWTSRNRSRLFSSIEYTRLNESVSIAGGIPKLRGDEEAFSHSSLRGLPTRFEDEWIASNRVTVGNVEDCPNGLLIGGTAYNWISVFGECRAAGYGVANPGNSPLLQLTFRDIASKWAAYGALASRVVYWLWRVEGDGFHVTRNFVAGLPFTSETFGTDWNTLSELGSDLWQRVSQRPVLSKNGGRETVSYCPHSEAALLDAIDEKLLSAVDLDVAFREQLAAFILKNAVVDFDDPIRTRKEGRPLASWMAI